MARCERCHGDGQLLHWRPVGRPTVLPCPECNGTGIAHCCDGLTVQPDADLCDRDPQVGEPGL